MPLNTSYNNVGIAIATHLSCIMAASIAILFVYLEARLIQHAARGLKINSNPIIHFITNNLVRIFIVIQVIQVVLFIIGIPLGHYGVVSKRIAFWIPVVIVDATIIPIFLILGITIYMKAKSAIKERHHKLAGHVLIAVIGCVVLGTFTGAVGVVASIGVFSYTDWVFVELCWVSDIGFNAFIFWLLSKPQTTTTTSQEPTSGGSNSDTVEVIKNPTATSDSVVSDA
jgi:hypothetical protein